MAVNWGVLRGGFAISIALFIQSAWSQSSPPGQSPVQAIFTDKKIKIDGELNDEAWQVAPAQSGLTQIRPFASQPSPFRTEFKILYSGESLYLGVTCFDPEMNLQNRLALKNETQDLFNDDLVIFLVDPHQDSKTAYAFSVNPNGARLDLKSLSNGNTIHFGWNGDWDVEVKREDDRWTIELRIPFFTLDYNVRNQSALKFNVVREIPRLGEESTWFPVPQNRSIYDTITFSSLRIDPLPHAKTDRSIQFSPYVASEFKNSADEIRGGFDLKYPFTNSWIGQFTYRTDFSEVDIDNQIINLNRYSIFYPEKRTFFLEGAENFEFGLPQQTQLFYSRRIGLDNGEVIPVVAGARTYGDSGDWRYGALDIYTDDLNATPQRNSAVLRGRKSSEGGNETGLMATFRNDTVHGDGSNIAAGADSTIRFLDSRLTFDSWGAWTRSAPNDPTTELEGNGLAGFWKGAWSTPGFHVAPSIHWVTDNFEPALGYVQRYGVFQPALNINRSLFLPEHGIASLTFFANAQHYFDDEISDSGDYSYSAGVNTYTNARWYFAVQGVHFADDVLFPFDLKPGVTIPTGKYAENAFIAHMITPEYAWLSLNLYYKHSGFFGGELDEIFPALVIKPSPGLYFLLEEDLGFIRLPDLGQEYLATVANFSASYAIFKNLFLDATIGWNRDYDIFNAQYRLNWEFLKLSHFYLVYSEERDATNFDTNSWGLTAKVVGYFSK